MKSTVQAAGRPGVRLDRPLRPRRASARTLHSAADGGRCRGAYSDGNGSIDPHRAWAVMMKDEKPGGHGERSGAVGMPRRGAVGLSPRRRPICRCGHCWQSATARRTRALDRNLCQRAGIIALPTMWKASGGPSAAPSAKATAASRSRSAARALGDDIKRIEARGGVLEHRTRHERSRSTATAPSIAPRPSLIWKR